MEDVKKGKWIESSAGKVKQKREKNKIKDDLEMGKKCGRGQCLRIPLAVLETLS